MAQSKWNFGTVEVMHDVHSKEAMRAMYFYEEGKLLPEPHRIHVQQIAVMQLNEGDSQSLTILYFDQPEWAKGYYDMLAQITADPGSAFPGGWTLFGNTVIIYITA